MRVRLSVRLPFGLVFGFAGSSFLGGGGGGFCLRSS